MCIVYRQVGVPLHLKALCHYVAPAHSHLWSCIKQKKNYLYVYRTIYGAVPAPRRAPMAKSGPGYRYLILLLMLCKLYLYLSSLYQYLPTPYLQPHAFPHIVIVIVICIYFIFNRQVGTYIRKLNPLLQYTLPILRIKY